MTDQAKITASYVPPATPPPGKILVKAPKDSRGYPIFPDLHLTISQAMELDDVLCEALAQYEDYEAGTTDAEPR